MNTVAKVHLSRFNFYFIELFRGLYPKEMSRRNPLYSLGTEA